MRSIDGLQPHRGLGRSVPGMGIKKAITVMLEAHNTGRASRYTARRTPVELAAAWELESERAARSLEWRIKQLSRSQKLALLGGAPLP